MARMIMRVGKMDTLFGELSRIEILDLWEGMSHVGNSPEIYYDTLRRFYGEFNRYAAGFIESFKTEDWKNYTVRIHAFKGAFANLGVENLRSWAYELETASREGDYGKCRRDTPQIMEAMEDFWNSLGKTSLPDKKVMP
jgi:HPt (histidine-containing phosphotransfer) domain-containing protein